ncbi:hypothetical protein Trydic_g12510 [Trypoxylus dichotomus]
MVAEQSADGDDGGDGARCVSKRSDASLEALPIQNLRYFQSKQRNPLIKSSVSGGLLSVITKRWSDLETAVRLSDDLSRPPRILCA